MKNFQHEIFITKVLLHENFQIYGISHVHWPAYYYVHPPFNESGYVPEVSALSLQSEDWLIS